MRDSRIELDPDDIDIVRSRFLHNDPLFADHIQVLQSLWLLWVADGPQVVYKGMRNVVRIYIRL